MSKLQPCPFCGAEVQDDERGEKYPRKSPMGGWIIHCECCGASLSQFRKSGKGEISWNTRPIEDELRARIAELEERLESCESALTSMVYQFFYLSESGALAHSFMSAEEEAAEYLVDYGIARWENEHRNSIVFEKEREE